MEGNADERGTTEYNLALGQKRAEAVSRAITLLGIDASRVEAISNGEEKPRAEGSTEEAWAENRRADLLIRQ
jgi:peptidoglycan-associated lipoprotein